MAEPLAIPGVPITRIYHKLVDTLGHPVQGTVSIEISYVKDFTGQILMAGAAQVRVEADGILEVHLATLEDRRYRFTFDLYTQDWAKVHYPAFTIEASTADGVEFKRELMAAQTAEDTTTPVFPGFPPGMVPLPNTGGSGNANVKDNGDGTATITI